MLKYVTITTLYVPQRTSARRSRETMTRDETNKLPKKPGRAPLQHTDVPDRPLAQLQVDFVGPFPQADGHPFRYVLQVQDVFSRHLMLLPAEDNTAETAARLVHDRWICTFDVPLVITSDRGPHFAAETFRSMCRRIGCAIEWVHHCMRRVKGRWNVRTS